MADIELVIKIPEVFYEALNQLNIVSCGRSNGKTFPLVLFNAIKNGTVLPKGHGRLIDADAFAIRGEYLEKLYGSDFYWEFKKQLDKQPTIIEVDKEESEE